MKDGTKCRVVGWVATQDLALGIVCAAMSTAAEFGWFTFLRCEDTIADRPLSCIARTILTPGDINFE